MIPAVAANMPPYTPQDVPSVISLPLLLYQIQRAARPAPAGWLIPPSRLAQKIAFALDLMAKKRGKARANPSVMLWMKSAIKTVIPSVGLAWLVA